MSLREKILSIDDKKRVPLVIPEWDGVTVYVTTMSAVRQMQYLAAAKAHPEVANSVLVAIFSAEDEAGKLVFSADDAQALSEKNAIAFRRIYLLVDEWTPSIEDLRKNSQAPLSPATSSV